MAQVNFRIDDHVKAEADALFARLGMNMSTAISIFIRQALRHRGLPFEIKDDPFYSAKNLTHLQRASRSVFSRYSQRLNLEHQRQKWNKVEW